MFINDICIFLKKIIFVKQREEAIAAASTPSARVATDEDTVID